MGTIVLECGCSITSAMGGGGIVSCTPCGQHWGLLQAELKALRDRMWQLQIAQPMHVLPPNPPRVV